MEKCTYIYLIPIKFNNIRSLNRGTGRLIHLKFKKIK